MFKTVLRVTTTLGVLLAGYAGYTRAFAFVAARLENPRAAAAYAHTAIESKTKRQAINLAKQAFPPGHWAAEEDLPIRIYNAERGFWIYARDYKRRNEGKRVEFTPFALIWRSRDGRGLKTVTSHSAAVDLDEPLGLVTKPGANSNLKVVHARIEGEVLLRDDKATTDPADDLRISGLTYIDYDEATLRVVSDDRDTVVIEDRVYRVVGKGLLIQLRPAEAGPAGAPSSGFNGAETAVLKREPFITLRDVGPGGMLPGNSGAARREGDPTPLTARSDGMLRVDLPKPKVNPRVGPPAPADPTYAHFQRNVEVVRGRSGKPQDQLYCDNLHLTLVPNASPRGRRAPAPDDSDEVLARTEPEASEGGLTLKRAVADGHNVRLLSEAQGIKARCNQLIHKKLWPDAPDETYLRGDPSTKLIVEKTEIAQEGPDKGKVTGFTTVRTIEATIFDDGRGNDHATIVARGPGDLESRPGLNAPVERTAHWLDQLTLQPEVARGKTGPTAAAGKRLTLTGSPGFNDIAAGTRLDARDLILVFLKPAAKAAATTAVAADGRGPARGPVKPGVKDPAVAPATFEIERLFARKDVRLDAPSRTLVAREWLDAQFEAAPPLAATGPAVSAVAAAAPNAGPNATASAAPAPAPPAKAAEPRSEANANRVSAKILLRPGAGADRGQGTTRPAGGRATPPATSLIGDGPGQRAEVQSVYLRGAVTYHQDAAPGKARGTDAAGEAIDVYNRGPDAAKFVIFHRDPKSADAARLGTSGTDPTGAAKAAVSPAAEVPGVEGAPLARIDIDDMTFRGMVIGVDQAADEAWIDGRGSLSKLAAVGLLSDKGLPGPPPSAPKAGSPRAADAAAPTPPGTTPMMISFGGRMRFFGRSTDMKGHPAARAEFYENVHAESNESILDCKDLMRVYLDRTVDLARAKTAPARPAPPGAAESQPQIAMIECVSDVVVINEKFDPTSGKVLQKQRIDTDYLIYDKRTGKFHANRPGIVYLYEREGEGPRVPGAGRGGPSVPVSAGANGRVIRPTSGTGADPNASPNPPVVGHNSPRNPADLKAARPRGAGSAAREPRPAERPLPPLVLTQVRFSREMAGRFGSGKETDRAETRWADFFGDVEALRARVPDADAVLDPDDRPADAQFLTSQVLRVVSEPAPGRPDAPPRYLLAAWENAFAADEDKTIQADRINYDSTNSLFYAYGDEGREVLISQQDQLGQPASVARGSAVRFNAKTGQSSLIDPKAGSLIDARTGRRPSAVSPPDPNVKPRTPKRIPFRNPRNIERKNFTGG